VVDVPNPDDIDPDGAARRRQRDEPIQRVAARPVAAVGRQQARQFETGPEGRPTVNDIAPAVKSQSQLMGVRQELRWAFGSRGVFSDDR
jgi:hypothetical protein